MSPIQQKLQTAFYPYLMTARHLRQATSYRLYTAYAYLGEVFVLLAGLGLANPVIRFLGGRAANAAGTEAPEPSVAAFLSGSAFGWVGIACLVIWGLLKFYVQSEELDKRCSLVKSYCRQCLQIEFAVHNALQLPDPMPALIQQQAKLSDLIDRNIAEGALTNNGIDDRFEVRHPGIQREIRHVPVGKARASGIVADKGMPLHERLQPVAPD